jgi:hypothetical protein
MYSNFATYRVPVYGMPSFVFINIPGCTLILLFPHTNYQVRLFVFNHFWGNPPNRVFREASLNRRGNAAVRSSGGFTPPYGEVNSPLEFQCAPLYR